MIATLSRDRVSLTTSKGSSPVGAVTSVMVTVGDDQVRIPLPDDVRALIAERTELTQFRLNVDLVERRLLNLEALTYGKVWPKKRKRA